MKIRGWGYAVALEPRSTLPPPSINIVVAPNLQGIVLAIANRANRVGIDPASPCNYRAWHGVCMWHRSCIGRVMRYNSIAGAGIYTGSIDSVEGVEVLGNVKFLDGVLEVTDLVDRNEFNGLGQFEGLAWG